MNINKKRTTILTCAIAAIVLLCSNLIAWSQETDPVKRANAVNDEKADHKVVDEDVADFLVKSADARMMDAKEGKLASQKGTSPAIREYGQLMIKDQSTLLEKIKDLAAKRKITLPSGISDKKENGREELAEESGKDFDEKFIKMMIIDHERDIKLFKKASECKDSEVSAFAQEYLPLIQSHLDKINDIKIALK